MKKIFEQPELQVQTFAVADILTTSSWYEDITPEPGTETDILPFSSSSPFSLR